MSYLKLRQKMMPELILKKIKEKLRKNNFNGAFLFLSLLGENYTKSEYFDKEENLFRLRDLFLSFFEKREKLFSTGSRIFMEEVWWPEVLFLGGYVKILSSRIDYVKSGKCPRYISIQYLTKLRKELSSYERRFLRRLYRSSFIFSFFPKKDMIDFRTLKSHLFVEEILARLELKYSVESIIA